MNILVFDLDATRLQATADTLGSKYQVTTCSKEQELPGLIPNHQVVILPEQVHSHAVFNWTKQYPNTIFIVAMERRIIKLIQEFMGAGVHECIKYPITLESVERLIGGMSVSPARQEVAATAAVSVAVAEPVVSRTVDEPIIRKPVTANRETEHSMPWSKPPVQSSVRREVSRPIYDDQEELPNPPEVKGKKRLVLPDEELEQGRTTPVQIIGIKKEVIAVTSARGGVGKTTVCYNLAALAAQKGLKTAVVDADKKGHMVTVSRTKYDYTTDTWDTLEDDPGESTVKTLLAKMTCGAYLVPAGKKVTGCSDETMAKIISNLERYYDVVIIDCEPGFTPATIEAYRAASKIVMVCSDDINSFGRTVEFINQLQDPSLLGIDSERIKLVLNDVEKDFAKDEEQILVDKARLPIIAKLPHSADIRKLRRQGKPAVLVPKLKFTKEMNQLMDKLVYVPNPKTLGGVFGKLFAWK